MNTLRSLRQRKQLTQKDVAVRFGTTQQTVARWETGKAEIPTAHLSDMAVFFGCGIDELLGAQRTDRRRTPRPARISRKQLSRPFGTLTASFTFGERQYPIDEEQREKVRRHFMRHACFSSSSELISFAALDNRLVFLNPAMLTDLKLNTDDCVEMPLFATREAYQALTKQTPKHLLSDEVASECDAILQRLDADWRTVEPSDFNRNSGPTSGLDAAAAMRCIRLVRATGSEHSVFLSDDGATAIMALDNATDELTVNSLIAIDEEGSDVHVVNLNSVAAIEVPLEAYLDILEADFEKDRTQP